MNNIINSSPYLRSSRKFPIENENLSIELGKAYIDTALCVNDRTIGLFPSNKNAITGEKWYLNKNEPQQSLRRAYTFNTTSSITHGIDLTQVESFSRMFGTYYDNTNWHGLITTSSTSIAGQIGFYVTSTQIVFTVGAGAPTLVKGNIVLEWLSFP